MKNYEEKDLLESYHIVSLVEKLTIVVIVILKKFRVQRLRQKKYCRMRYFINGKSNEEKTYWNQIFILTILSAPKEDIYGEKENLCGIMSHRIGDAWNLFLLFKENRMGNDR